MSDLTYRSKTLATWLAVVGGSVGLHRFYLHGRRDAWGWLMPLPTLIGWIGVQRARQIGQDDHLAWLLIPLLGVMITQAMVAALVYGLTPDEKWAARFNPRQPPVDTRWGPILGVIVALLAGATVLMSTVAFAGQRFFEWQSEAAQGARLTPATWPIRTAAG